MSSLTFAACREEGSCSADETQAGPRSSLLPSALASGFWTNRGSAKPKPPAHRRTSAQVADPATDGRGTSQAALVSHSMRSVFELLQRLAPTDVTVTLIGETGTGKDVLARLIHQNSARASAPFVVFDCAAVAPNLAESELFGHERGAFTGALSTHVGAFERANGGTLFLDEIGELPQELQTRLLRVLGNRSVRRVGGTIDRPVDVRIVAATNRELQGEVAAGRFRQDLYFRLATAIIQVPALRERREDIPMLARCLLEDMGRPDVELAPAALAALAKRAWPGNVRELKNALAFAVAFLDGTLLEPRHLTLQTPAKGECGVEQLPLGGQRLDEIERVAIQQTLRLTSGNKARAAQLLGIAPSTLYEKLKKLARGDAQASAAE